jgi:hypothetical protein|tara:strand:+ start:5978 stop:6259 length:282 start_codon:yes stop_codon:yes gene_type:complete
MIHSPGLNNMTDIMWFSMLLIFITAIMFFYIGLRTDMQANINRESFNAGIKEGVSGVLQIMEQEGVIRRNLADDDYEMPDAVSYDSDDEKSTS